MHNNTTKFHPILFSIPMVQAIINGTKTQTRRVVKPKYNNTDLVMKEFNSGLTKVLLEIQNDLPAPRKNDNGSTTHWVKATEEVKCPYEVGDVLWLRETFRKVSHYGFEDSFIEYKSGGNNAHCTIVDEDQIIPMDKWKPSIHMPKEHARIFLKIKSIRVERLQDISEHDAQQEGAKDRLKHSEMKVLEGLGDWTIPSPFRSHQFGFLSIWCSIYGCENWLENPFVWVYEFEKIEKPLNFI